MTRYRILVVIVLLPLLAGCLSAGDPRAPGTESYGLYPRKGTLAIGADADIVVYDPSRSVMITNSILHHNVDYTPYEGLNVTRWPEIVVSCGEIVFGRDGFVGTAGRGKFLACAQPELATPKSAG